jgi:hypothetical protein
MFASCVQGLEFNSQHWNKKSYKYTHEEKRHCSSYGQEKIACFSFTKLMGKGSKMLSYKKSLRKMKLGFGGCL